MARSPFRPVGRAVRTTSEPTSAPGGAEPAGPGSSWRVVAALLGVVCVTLIAPALFAGKVLSATDVLAARDPSFTAPRSDARATNPLRFDALYVFGPDLREARRQIRAGTLPAWMTGVGAGRPLLAAQQHAVFFPLQWLAIVLPFERSLALILALKVLLAGLGVLLLARSLGLRPAPALLGALGYGLGSYFVSWLEHPHTNLYLLLPWLLLAVGSVVRPQASWRTVLALGATCGLVALGGHPGTAITLTLFAAAYGATAIVSQRRLYDRDSVIALALRVGAGGLLAAIVGAMAILPFLDALRQGIEPNRGGPGGPASVLATLFAPDLWGDPGNGRVEGPRNFAERSFYVGIATLVLAAAGTLSQRRSARFFTGALVACLLLAIDVPLLSSVLDVPGRDAYINQLRLLAFASFCLSMLAAHGLQAILDDEKRTRRAAFVAAGLVAVGCAMAAALLGPVVADDVRLNALIRPAILAFGVLGVLMLFVRADARRRPLIALLLVVATGIELLASAHGYYRFLDPDRANAATPPAVVKLRPTDHLDRVTGQFVLGPNLALDYGLFDARVHDHPAVRRHSRLWRALVPQSPVIRTDYFNTSEQSRKALDLFSVRRVLSSGSPGAGLRDLAKAGNGLVVSENRTALPRAATVSSWSAARDEDDALAKVVATDRDTLRNVPVIEGPPPSIAGAARAPQPQQITRYEPDRVSVSVRAPRGGMLVLTDTYFEGWEATVDGRATKVLPADVAFRAVRVPAGASTVEFRYRSAAVTGGVLWSGIGVLILLLGGFLVLRERRPGYVWRLVSAASWTGTQPIGLGRRISLTWARMEQHLKEATGLPEPIAESPAKPADRPGRGASRGPRLLLAVAVMALLGAIVAASLKPLPADRFRADALVGIAETPTGDSNESSWRTFASAVESPQVAHATARSGGVAVAAKDVPDLVEAVGDPRSRVLRVRARADSPAAAVALADAVAAQALALSRQLARASLIDTSPRSLFGFENGLDGFTASSEFSTLASGLTTTELSTGARALRFRCSGPPGCGPGVVVQRQFVAGKRYTARARIRAGGAPGPVRLVLGSGSDDVATSPSVTISSARDAELTVRWTPKGSGSSAIVALQTTADQPVAVLVDDVEVRDPKELLEDSDLASRSRELAATLRARRAAQSDRYASVGNATSSGTLTVPTARWAAIGALVGILVTIAGHALADQARRCQR